MNKTTIIGPALALLVSLTACQSSVANTQAACLLEQAQNPCALLTPDTLQPFLPEGTTAQPSPTVSGSCSYAWEGGRQQTISVGAMEFSAPLEDSANLTGIRSFGDTPEAAKARFANAYRSRTEAEKAKMGETAAAAANAEAQKRGADSSLSATTADMARRMFSNTSWQPVAGVGDAAAWGGIGKFRQLHVLSGTVELVVALDRNDDPEMKRADSVALANAILEVCK